MDELETELRKEFLDETTQGLVQAEQYFLELEKAGARPEIVDHLFRLAHNIKGSAGAVGFRELGDFTHLLESLLLKIKKSELEATRGVIDLLLRCTDHLCMMVNGLKNDPGAVFTSEALVGKMKDCLEGRLREARPPEAEPSVPLPKAEVHEPRAAEDSIRVGIDRLENLINFVGELVILQSVLNEQSRQVESPALQKTVVQMGKVLKNIQAISMGLRMVPLRKTFLKLERVVRDASLALGKSVQIEVSGGDTEVDKTVLERLGDPLVHLVRNAVDHGIEAPEARKKAGKPETGRIHLHAFHRGNQIVIEILDDGGGLDPEKLRNAAISKGLLKPDSTVSDQEAYQFIFQPGFSTKREVTDISGRGVGLDVVKSHLELLQGSVELKTELGKGTLFRISLPLTLAIIEGVVVSAGAERLVIPLAQIHESIRPDERDIHAIAGAGEVLSIRGENLPLYRITDLIGWRSRSAKASDGIALVVRMGEKPFAVLVDDLLGLQQIVVKKLGRELRGIRGFTGCAILGDGRPAVIVDVVELTARLRAQVRSLRNERSEAA